MLVMRRHRSRPSGGDVLILLPSMLLSAATWLPFGPTWIAAGLLIHLAWFVYCENRFPAPVLAAAVSSRAAARPTAPVGPRPVAQRAVDASGAAAPSRSPVTVPVLAVFDETPDIKTFRIQRPDGFDFSPGQFLTIRVQVDGKPVQRAYSISSSPHSRGYLEISVKRIGLVSGVLHTNLRPGSLVTVRPPAGSFVYPSGDDRPLLLLAGGIGITPLMSMLRHAVATDPTRPVTLIYSVKTPDDLAFRDELALISRRHPQVRIAVCVSQGPASDRWCSGRVTAQIVRACMPEPVHALTCICGPKPMMDAMMAMMAGLGVPSGQVRSESFGAAMRLVTTESDAPAALAPASRSSAHVAQTIAGAPEAEEVLVRFARTGCEARVPTAQTLLEAAEARGVDLPFMCRAGTCHTCRTRVLDGDVVCESDTLSDDDRANGFVLPCVSHARSDCALEA